MAVGKASRSRKCRILLGLRSWILILGASSSSCHILLVFMKVVFIHFPWLRWARSERPAPTNEEFLPAHQPLPITKFCSTVESRIPTANEGFADISRCLSPNEWFSNISSLICGSEHQESWRKLPSLPPIQMMHYFAGCQIILEHPVALAIIQTLSALQFGKMCFVGVLIWTVDRWYLGLGTRWIRTNQ